MQVFLLFGATIIEYYGRINISMALVAITDSSAANPDFPEFKWTKTETSLILSSFMWSYVLTQFPGGYLSHRYGSKLVLTVAVVGSSVFSLINPTVVIKTEGSVTMFCLIRVFQGFFQGILFPAVFGHLCKWMPTKERSTSGAIALLGCYVGIMISMGGSGMLAASPMGWPGIFYFAGGLGFVWTILWLIFGEESPETSKFIRENELRYIQLNRETEEKKVKLKTPWKSIATSKPFWAILVAKSAESWGTYTQLTELPAYLHGVMQFRIEKNGIFSALPQIGLMVMYVILIVVIEYLVKRNVSMTIIRKTLNSIGTFIPMVALVIIGFLNKDYATLAVVLFVICGTVHSGEIQGNELNVMDIAPNFSDVVLGIINTIAHMWSLVAPLFAGWVVKDEVSWYFF